MNEKRIPLTEEEPKYKKKSKGNGLPRSKHKHTYETVLLYSYYHHTDLKTGADKITESKMPTKVCTICGRVDAVDFSYYNLVPIDNHPFNCKERVLKEEALNLPKWYVKDYFDKFAIEMK